MTDDEIKKRQARFEGLKRRAAASFNLRINHEFVGQATADRLANAGPVRSSSTARNIGFSRVGYFARMGQISMRWKINIVTIKCPKQETAWGH